METLDKIYKVAHVKNLNQFSFNSTITTPIDSNANIKTILDIKSYIFDNKVECGSGKAILSGKIGIKVVYLDTDNMTNSVSAYVNFSETILDACLTGDTYLDISSTNIVNTILSIENILKVNCEVAISPIAYLNLGLPNNSVENDSIYTKHKEVSSTSITKNINTQFNYTTNSEVKDTLSKILSTNNYLSVEKTTAEQGFVVVEGKILTSVMYETQTDTDTQIKEHKETFNFKCDFEVDGVDKDSLLDLSFCLDNSTDNISTEHEDNANIITINHLIKVNGVVLKDSTIEVLEDAFSTTHDIETFSSKRDFMKCSSNASASEVIYNELTLQKEETAIDEVVANLSISPEITNTYIKDNFVYVEGIILSNLVYIDENKELKLKPIEIPFIINTKIEATHIDCVHSNIALLDSKVKVKRGTILEFEYSLFITFNLYIKDSCEMIDNLKLGKPIQCGDYDFQIFIAKPEETVWELCKRIKIAPSDIAKYNKDLPMTCVGGEKVIIKR